ncbi:aspartyl-phosphate phosphatase Spo0E family protein [Aquibacillus koreensis]|uniref:Aspartyl-phosphate phosphatase Spo0E family protein n=1 Tax=Aquibacillus koreensis TaxID=279446 RepID=A0A9X3WST9_9BACI|nr:aspartyl-phosphate phosphatase Spo0E family protein [Aquibacillus koreensis]MCT2535252.1 aspartyl-phosphate phosphatase Spo0E family protein [Aquibacillus koreensis]MDC3422789.1 aspartyl-phosphate phosphatase Spo0E family protein [Aquibacillus koreensis]
MLSCLEKRIEEVRAHMYEAYAQNVNYENVLEISQELDRLLNKLTTQGN